MFSSIEFSSIEFVYPWILVAKKKNQQIQNLVEALQLTRTLSRTFPWHTASDRMLSLLQRVSCQNGLYLLFVYFLSLYILFFILVVLVASARHRVCMCARVSEHLQMR